MSKNYTRKKTFPCFKKLYKFYTPMKNRTWV